MSDAASYLNWAHPHPPESVNLLLSLTMKPTPSRASGTTVVGSGASVFLFPSDLRYLGAVGERLPIAGNTGPVGVNPHGVGKDHIDHGFDLADGDSLPVFVSSELRERGGIYSANPHSAPREGSHNDADAPCRSCSRSSHRLLQEEESCLQIAPDVAQILSDQMAIWHPIGEWYSSGGDAVGCVRTPESFAYRRMPYRRTTKRGTRR